MPEKTWARLTSFFAIKLCLQTLVKSRASRDWQPHNSQLLRSIRLEHRSWKITTKSHLIDWQRIKRTEKNLENSTSRQWTEPNNHLIGAKLFFKYDPTGYNDPKHFDVGRHRNSPNYTMWIKFYQHWGWHPPPPCVLRTALFWHCVLRTVIFLPRVHNNNGRSGRPIF